MKIYDVKEVEWKITSDQIGGVYYDKWTEKYLIIILPDYLQVNINKDVFKLFKKEFPEHCITIGEINEIKDL